MKTLASKSIITFYLGLFFLAIAGSVFLTPWAKAESLVWDWRVGNCGVEPGGILDTYTLPNQPGTEICVIPPSYQFNAQIRLYVGVYIGNQYFGETSELPDPVKGRCATPTTSSTLIRSSTICTVLGGRLGGSINYTPSSISSSTTCTNCTDCTDKLSNSAFTTVYLINDIEDQVGNCISADLKAITNKIFDCGGHVIDGDDMLLQGGYPDYGVFLWGFMGDNGNTIRNCVISDFSVGIYGYDAKNNTFQDNTLTSNSVGIDLYGDNPESDNNLIRNNLFEGNTQIGLSVRASNTNIVIGNRTVQNGSYGIYSYGIYLDNSDYNQIAYNTASGNTVGLSAGIKENNVIEHNEFVNNTSDGANVSGSGNFSWNTACGNGEYDVRAATIVTANAGDNNKCDTYWLWHDYDISQGCTFSCTAPAVCGNNVLEPPEQCDDGNTASGDGCDATCKTEFCGDGITQPALQEQCDDGNTASGDGCDATCKTEFCGDGILQPALQEQCDDGNTASGDGCDATCTIEQPNTPVGSGVEVTDSATGAEITFDEVTTAGTTLVAASETGPTAPSGFRLASDPPRYYEITTTAAFAGANVCIPYDEDDVLEAEENLKLLHWNVSSWEDVAMPLVDTVANVICGATTSLSPFAVMEPLTEILEATVDFNPKTLNLKSSGKWVTVYIELPEGYDPANINVSSVTFAESVVAEKSPTEIGDYDEDGIPDRMFKFNRAEVSKQLNPSEEVTVKIQGQLVDGTPFAGTDTIRVIAM